MQQNKRVTQRNSGRRFQKVKRLKERLKQRERDWRRRSCWVKLEEGRKRKPERGEKNEKEGTEKGKFQNGQNKRDTRREKFEHWASERKGSREHEISHQKWFISSEPDSKRDPPGPSWMAQRSRDEFHFLRFSRPALLAKDIDTCGPFRRVKRQSEHCGAVKLYQLVFTLERNQ